MRNFKWLLLCFAFTFLGCSEEEKDETLPTNTKVTPKPEDIQVPSGVKVKKEPLNRRSPFVEFEGIKYFDAADVSSDFNNILTGTNTTPGEFQFGKKANGQYSIWVTEGDDERWSYVFQFFKDGTYLWYNYVTQDNFWGYYKITTGQDENYVLFDDQDPRFGRSFRDVIIDNKKITFTGRVYDRNGGWLETNLVANRYDLIDEDYIDFIEFSTASYNAGIDDDINPNACFEIIKAVRYTDYSEVDLTGELQFMQFNPDGSLAVGYDGATTFQELWDYQYIERELDPVADEELYDFFGPNLIGFKVINGNNTNYVYVIDIDYVTKEFYCIYYDEVEKDLVMFVMR